MHRPHGSARIDPRNPSALGICDRCSFLYNLRDLSYQFAWAGTKLINTRLRVCKKCLDRPNEQLRARILPPDPVPVADPRPENYAAENLGRAAGQSGGGSGFAIGISAIGIGGMPVWEE